MFKHDDSWTNHDRSRTVRRMAPQCRGEISRAGWPLFRRPSDGTALRSDERLFGGFLAHARIDAAGRGRAGTTRIDGENGAVRMEIGKNVPIP
ncbi:hypothetical protein ACKZDW_18270 [Ralstonia syzygii subsp. celebesensis]|uniref:hypothetical protein n=1 Tax=Ralstonia syzygii TaxID=28097 RepID=UPI00387E0374